MNISVLRRFFCIVAMASITLLPSVTKVLAETFGPSAPQDTSVPLGPTYPVGGDSGAGTGVSGSSGAGTGVNGNSGVGSGVSGNAGPGNPVGGNNGQNAIVNPTSFKNICDFINTILNIVAEIGAIVAVMFIIWSGFLFIKAQGNKSEIQTAKSTFYTTIIGTAILVGASVITKIIINTVGAVATSVNGSSGGNICSK